MNPDTTRPAANDSPETVTLRIRAPRGVPITIKQADEYGPWWSAISGSVTLISLVFILGMAISG